MKRFLSSVGVGYGAAGWSSPPYLRHRDGGPRKRAKLRNEPIFLQAGLGFQRAHFENEAKLEGRGRE